MNELLEREVDGLVVYELSSDSYRDAIARMFLKDVRVRDDALHAVLGAGS